ncbi:MAG: tetratricopeptide repeat protein [Candidatus Heimdallarchaeota archaeon]
MSRRPKESVDRLWRAEELMHQGKLDEARPLIDSLEKETNFSPEDQLTYQLMKSQLLITTGDIVASHQLAELVWKTSQERGKPLVAIDACIIMTEALTHLSKFEESLKAIARGEQLLTTLTDEAPTALTQRKASFIHLRGRICLYKAEWDSAMDYFQQSLALRQEINNKHDIAVSLRNVGVIYGHKGDVEQALDYHQQALKLFQEVGNKHRVAWCLTNLCSYQQEKGEFDRALENGLHGLALFRELGNRNMVAYALGMVGGVYHTKGELNRALEYYHQQLAIVEEVGNKWLLGNCIAAIGGLHWNRGEVEQAAESFQQFLTLGQELDNKLIIATGLGWLGLIHWQKGDLEQALAYCQDCLSYYEEQGNNITVGFCLFWMLQVSLDMGSPEQAEQYLERLQHIHEQEDHKGLNQCYRVAQALVLKTSQRIRDKAKAQELLQQIIEEEMLHFINTQLAMINLCELLLDELKAYGEINVLQEAKRLVDKLYSLAQDRHSHSLVVNSLILQAKFAMIEGDLTTAAQYLEQARVTAEENSLGRLAAKVSDEISSLQGQYETWQQLIQRNAPFHERLEHAQITDYLKDVERLVGSQSPEISS